MTDHLEKLKRKASVFLNPPADADERQRAFHDYLTAVGPATILRLVELLEAAECIAADRGSALMDLDKELATIERDIRTFRETGR